MSCGVLAEQVTALERRRGRDYGGADRWRVYRAFLCGDEETGLPVWVARAPWQADIKLYARFSDAIEHAHARASRLALSLSEGISLNA